MPDKNGPKEISFIHMQYVKKIRLSPLNDPELYDVLVRVMRLVDILDLFMIQLTKHLCILAFYLTKQFNLKAEVWILSAKNIILIILILFGWILKALKEKFFPE